MLTSMTVERRDGGFEPIKEQRLPEFNTFIEVDECHPSPIFLAAQREVIYQKPLGALKPRIFRQADLLPIKGLPEHAK